MWSQDQSGEGCFISRGKLVIGSKRSARLSWRIRSQLANPNMPSKNREIALDVQKIQSHFRRRRSPCSGTWKGCWSGRLCLTMKEITYVYSKNFSFTEAYFCSLGSVQASWTAGKRMRKRTAAVAAERRGTLGLSRETSNGEEKKRRRLSRYLPLPPRPPLRRSPRPARPSRRRRGFGPQRDSRRRRRRHCCYWLPPPPRLPQKGGDVSGAPDAASR